MMEFSVVEGEVPSGKLKNYLCLDSTHRDSDLFGLWCVLGIRIF